ncbi:MAG: hypothetical protein GX256_02770 [Fretibacterium sp.]|nr:hypothetical protein [Fretibacterium sp.]
MKAQKYLFLPLLLACLYAFLLFGAEAATTKKRRPLKNAPPPPGWQYEMGYALWRLEKGVKATPLTWKHYQREKRWQQQRGKEGLSEKLISKPLDWTLEELAFFLKEQNGLRFHPAGEE